MYKPYQPEWTTFGSNDGPDRFRHVALTEARTATDFRGAAPVSHPGLLDRVRAAFGQRATTEDPCGCPVPA